MVTLGLLIVFAGGVGLVQADDKQPQLPGAGAQPVQAEGLQLVFQVHGMT